MLAPALVIGAKSFTGSNGMLLKRCTFDVIMASVPIIRVYPSGAARATWAAPTLPLAPGRFSITMGWPRAACRRSCTARTTVSLAPPDACADTTVIGLVG